MSLGYTYWILYIVWIKVLYAQTRFIEEPQPKIEVDPTSTVMIKCRVSGHVEALMWFKDGNAFYSPNIPLNPPSGVSISQDYLVSGVLDLTIANVNLQMHDGSYYCVVYYTKFQNDFIKSKTAELTIRKPPDDILISYNEVIMTETSIIEAEAYKSALNLVCEVKRSNPATILQWFIGIEPVELNTDQNNVQDSLQPKLFNSQLKFTNVFKSENNGKMLECVAHHPSLKQTMKTGAKLNILFPPEITVKIIPPNTDIIENRTITVICDVAANPSAKGSWIRNGAGYGTGPEMTFQRLSRLDGGTYTCTASNRINGNDIRKELAYDLDVKFPVFIKSIDIQGNPKIGNIITFVCGVHGNPFPDVTWHQMGDPHINRGNASVLSLKVDYSMSGEYQCIGRNIINGRVYEEKSKSKMLMVEGHPVIQSKEHLSKEVFKGESNKDFSLSVMYCSNPKPESKWVLPEGELSAGVRGRFTVKTKEVKTYCYEDELIIRNAAVQDSGYYQFRVSNNFAGDGVTLNVVINASVDTGLVIGLVIGLVVLAIIGVILIVYTWREKKLCFQQAMKPKLENKEDSNLPSYYFASLPHKSHHKETNDHELKEIDSSLDEDWKEYSISSNNNQNNSMIKEDVQTPNNSSDRIIYANIDKDYLNANAKKKDQVQKSSVNYAAIQPRGLTPTMV